MAQFRSEDLVDAALLIGRGATVEDTTLVNEPAFVLLGLVSEFMESCEHYSIDPFEAWDELLEAIANNGEVN